MSQARKSVTLPVKRVEGDSLEERMTENAYKRILPARYLRQDEDGESVEDQEQLFERVAKNVALADAVYAAEKAGETIHVRPDQVKPRHSDRTELVHEVFGEDAGLDSDVETVLTEENVNKFAYDTVVPELPEEVRAEVVETRERFQELMERLAFTPNSPTLMNAGDELQQLSACFVDSPMDDMEDIHETAKEAAAVFQSGGGMGYAFWKLRPYGDPVGSTGGIASGPITFMRTFDQMCFVPGTKVLTPAGQVPIEDLGKGDVVIDENGDEQPVVETMEREVNEEIVEITPKRINKPLRTTREHPFKVVRDDGFEWVDAGDLEEGDYLVLGNSIQENGLELDGTVDLTQVASGPLVFTDGGLRINREYYGARKGSTPVEFDSQVPTEEFATVTGWYLAEGSIRYQRGIPSTVTFTLNNDETEFAEEIRGALDAFGVSSRVREIEDRNTLHVHVENTSFAQFVESVFGTGAMEKTVPDVVWNASPEVQARVVKALFDGDGRLEKRGDSQRATLKLVNEEIIDFVFQAGLRGGVQFSRHDREPDDRKPTYSVGVSVSTAVGTELEDMFDEVPDDFCATDRTKQAYGREVVEVTSIDWVEYDGSVHNVEVDGTHTYVAEDIVVHNCETIAQGGTRRGAQMGVMRVSHPDVIQFIHAKNKDVSLAHALRLNDPDDYTHTSFVDALDEARELIDDEGRVPKHLRNAAEGHLSNFNISVGITDSFMEALENDENYTFTNPRTGEPHVATSHTKELYDRFGMGEYVEEGEVLSVPASEIWTRIVEGAWENGEPGVIYLERVNKEHSFDVEEYSEHRILATNPCGEQPLEEYEACNLGHINLSTLASRSAPDWREWREENSHTSLEEAVSAFLEDAIDWQEFSYRVEVGTHFLENVVTMSDFPIPEIEEKVREMRKIGLGIMGLAQLYIQLGVRYGSEEANEIARQLMRYINHESKRTSHELAEERGVFAEWSKSKYADPTRYSEWFEWQTGEDADEWRDGYPIRNHNTTTIAPTGTTSMIGNTTGGCEPIYNVAYYKNVTDDVQGDEMLVEFDDYFLRVLEANDIDVDEVKEEAQEQMAENRFDGVEGLESVPDAIGELFVTTGDLSAKEHAAVQCACQEGVDSAISKTVNAPNDSSVEDAKEVFEYIYRNGGKGVTYYRDGTRSKQVLTTRAENKAAADDVDHVEAVREMIREDEVSVDEVVPEEVKPIGSDFAPRARPDTIGGATQKIETGYGGLYVTVNEDEEGLFEVFAQIGKSGGYTTSFTEAIARLTSLCLRSGIPPEQVISQLEGIRSPKVTFDRGEQIHSVPDGIAKAMNRYITGEVKPQQSRLPLQEPEEEDETESDGGRSAVKRLVHEGRSPECPDCSSMSLVYTEGCVKCKECGFSEC